MRRSVRRAGLCIMVPRPMRRLLPLLLLLPALALAASPAPRIQRHLDAERWADAVQMARSWLGRNGDDADAAALREQLAEAEYQLLTRAPSQEKAAAWQAEFAGTKRADAVRNLEANLALYAASDAGTEEAYRAVVDSFPGTPAATEAAGRAEGVAFEAAEADGSLAAWSRFLGDYPSGRRAEGAREQHRARAWEAAEAEDTVQAWFRLRADDPEHPRVEEALAREQELALAALGRHPEPGEVLKVARRYRGEDAGWAAALRLLELAPFETNQGLRSLAQLASEPADGLASVAWKPPGTLPRGLELAIDVQAGEQPWRDRAGDGTTRTWATDAPLCAEGAAVTLTLSLTAPGRSEDRTVPLDLQRPCGGPVPLAVHRDEDGFIDGVGAVVGGKATRTGDAPDALGLPWNCDSILADERGAWLGCNGWQLRAMGAAWVVRLPSRGRSAERPDPMLDSLGEGWVAVDTPPSWAFGGGRACPLDDREGESLAALPAWLPPTAARTETTADVDGDGQMDRLVQLEGWWLVQLAGMPANTGVALPGGGLDGWHRDGCDLVPGPWEAPAEVHPEGDFVEEAEEAPAEESPAAEPVEQVPVEEAPAEEPPAAEPVEQVPAEEAPAEEAPADEPVEAEPPAADPPEEGAPAAD